jgi:arabinosyltransferase C
LPVLLPLLAAGLAVLVVIFADQTLAAVREATRIRTAIGPNLGWFEESVRYQWLFGGGVEGSLARRFPVLVLLLCVGTCLVVLLRRNVIPGASLGPSRRLIGTAALSLAALALTPTKWTHHFGAFAPIGAGLAALTALATSGSVLRSKRNRAAFVSGLLALTALAFTGFNGWFSESGFGVPWFDKPPSIHGFTLSTVLLIAAGVVAAVAVVEHIRFDPTVPPKTRAAPERRRRALRLGTAPLSVLCGLMVLFELASLLKGATKQYDSYSITKQNVQSLAGHECGLSDQVLVEQNAAADVLAPLPAGDAGSDAGSTDNFDPDPGSRPADPPSDTYPASDFINRNDPAPYNLGSVSAPVWRSDPADDRRTGKLVTSWYQLTHDGDAPLVITVAGLLSNGNSLHAEFGHRTADGVTTVSTKDLSDPANTVKTAWREIRLSANQWPAGADTVRLIATDGSLADGGWMAVSAPRVPRLTPLTTLAADQPMMLDWTVGFINPCLQPLLIHGGVAQLPAYRLLADISQRPAGTAWAAGAAGGPLGWLDVSAAERLMPAYLKGDESRDWGQLRMIQPYLPAARPAQLVHTDRTEWGLWSPGPQRLPIPQAADQTR